VQRCRVGVGVRVKRKIDRKIKLTHGELGIQRREDEKGRESERYPSVEEGSNTKGHWE